MKHKHVGSTFDEFLNEEGISAEVAAKAAKKAFAYELQRKMELKHKRKNAFRQLFKSASTADRLFNDHTGISLETMAKAAHYVGYELAIHLVRRNGR